MSAADVSPPRPPSRPPPQQQPSRRRRWLGLALVASLAANLFLIGILAGGWLARGPGAAFDPAAGPGGVPSMIRSLPQTAREAAFERFAERRSTLRGRMIELRAARRDVYRALVAEDFDRADLDAAFAQVRRQVSALQEGLHDGIAAVAEQLDAEDRGQMAESLRGMLRGGRSGMRRPGAGGFDRSRGGDGMP